MPTLHNKIFISVDFDQKLFGQKIGEKTAKKSIKNLLFLEHPFLLGHSTLKI